MCLNEIARLFNNDISEKKRIGNSTKHRVATRKGSGNQPLRTPSAFMSRKEIDKLNGVVKVYNQENILPVEEFDKLSKEEQKDSLIIWRKMFPTNLIKEKMGISNSKFYAYIEELNIETNRFKKENKKHNKQDINLDDFEEVYKEAKKVLIISDRDKPILEYFLIPREPINLRYLIVVNYLEAYNGASNLCKAYESVGQEARTSYFYNNVMRMKKIGIYDKMVELNDRLCKKLAIDRKQKEVIKSALDEIKEEENNSSKIDDKKEDVIIMEEDIKVVNQHENPKITEQMFVEKNNIETNVDIDIKGFNLVMNGYYTSKDIVRKLSMVIDELENNDTINKLNLELKGL